MAKVKFTSALNRFFPKLREVEIGGDTVREVLVNIEKIYPGISSYIVDDNGHLRKHLNIFVRGELISDRKNLNDLIKQNDELLVFQALSGG